MIRLFVLVSAVMLLASCESNRSTFVDVSDGKMFNMKCGHYNQYLYEGDTIIYSRNLSSTRLTMWENFYGVYQNTALPANVDYDSWNKDSTVYSYRNSTYHIAVKIDM